MLLRKTLEEVEAKQFLKSLGIVPEYEPEFETPNPAEINGETNRQ